MEDQLVKASYANYRMRTIRRRVSGETHREFFSLERGEGQRVVTRDKSVRKLFALVETGARRHNYGGAKDLVSKVISLDE